MKSNVFFEVYEQINEENDEWILRSSHITEELAEQWIMELIDNNPDYEDINFRVDECEEDLTNPLLS